jgi:hypothetical protein
LLDLDLLATDVGVPEDEDVVQVDGVSVHVKFADPESKAEVVVAVPS